MAMRAEDAPLTGRPVRWLTTMATLRAGHASLGAEFCAAYAPDHPHLQSFHRVPDTVRVHIPRIPRAAVAAVVCVDRMLHVEAQRRLALPAAPAAPVAPAAFWAWGEVAGPGATGNWASGDAGGEELAALGTFGGDEDDVMG
jgi:hypothetical protein